MDLLRDYKYSFEHQSYMFLLFVLFLFQLILVSTADWVILFHFY